MISPVMLLNIKDPFYIKTRDSRRVAGDTKPGPPDWSPALQLSGATTQFAGLKYGATLLA